MVEVSILPQVRDFMNRLNGQFINGKTVVSQQDEVITITNPATDEVIAHVATATSGDIDYAVDSAHRAFHGGWADVSPAQRGLLLNRLADLMIAHREELAQIETLTSGKLITLSRAFEVDYAVSFVRYYAGWTTRIEGKTVALSLPSASGEKYTGLTLREPLGVVAGIVPWNFSIMIAVWKFGSALACGCTAVIKPSEVTPLTMLRVAELAIEAGIPPGVLNVINGPGQQVGHALTTHPKIAKVTFTGGMETGAIIGTAALQSGFKRVTLELGGKNAAGFLPDVSPEKTVEGIIEAGFLNSGQVCASAERYYVHRSLINDVAEQLGKRLATLTPGDPMDDESCFGPLANRSHFNKVIGYFTRARDQNLTFIHGGGAFDLPGCYIQPTAVLAQSENDELMRQEVFGPVASLLAYDSVDELVTLMNDSPYGLAASLWTNNLSQALRLIPRVEAGTVWVNMHNYIDPAMPFGGTKGSGIGREFGSAFIDHFTEIKSVIMRY